MQDKRRSNSNNEYVGYKVRIFPTKEQVKLFYEYFGMSKFVYNKCIELQNAYTVEYEDYLLRIKNGEKLPKQSKRLSFETLGLMFTKIKKEEEPWLKKFNSAAIDGAIGDCCQAYKFYDDCTLEQDEPRFKGKFSKKQFYSRPERMTISDNYIKLSSIGKIKYCNSYGPEIIGSGNKDKKSCNFLHFYNVRVSFDGLHFYLSFNIVKDKQHQQKSCYNYYSNEEWQYQEESDAIGIDVGVNPTKWFVDSTGTVIERPDSSKLRKRIARNQRKLIKAKQKHLNKDSSYLEHHPNWSKNIQKLKQRINKDFKKIVNRRKNVVHKYACNLISQKPKAVVIEDISVRRLRKPKARELNAMIHDAAIYTSMEIIQIKLHANGIKVIKAPKDYPSSQLCSFCGNRHKIGKEQIYTCPVCGNSINRDLNAAINLSRLVY